MDPKLVDQVCNQARERNKCICLLICMVVVGLMRDGAAGERVHEGWIPGNGGKPEVTGGRRGSSVTDRLVTVPCQQVILKNEPSHWWREICLIFWPSNLVKTHTVSGKILFSIPSNISVCFLKYY